MRLRRRTLLAGAAASVAVPRLAVAADTLRVAVISDLNGSYRSTDYAPDVDAAIARIVGLAPDLVLCTGDMIAGQRRAPTLTEAELTAMWDAFHAHVTDPLASAGIPMLVTPGNHDASAYPGFERERQVFDRVWTARAPDIPILDGERYPFRYAAVVRDLLLIGLDIALPGPPIVEETEWLQQMLIETRGRYWVTIVFGHLPIWPVAQGREADVIGDAAFEALLVEGGTNLYLSGHHHAYFPGRSGGLLQIAQGCLGDAPRRLIGSTKRSPKSFTLLTIGPEDRIAFEALLPTEPAESDISEGLIEGVGRIGPLQLER